MSAPFYVGEGRMLLNEPATAQVLAKTNCTILSLDQKACAQLKTWGNEALKRIERVMRIRALERKLTATSGTIFTGLKNDPLFMSSILAFANRTGTSEQLHFIFAVEELKQAESLEEALEAFQTIWSSFVDPDVSSDEARKRALKVDLALDDRLALDAIAQPIFAAVNGHAAVTLVDVTSAFDAPSEKCASRVSEEVIPEFMRCDEYEDFVDQMFPIPIPRPNRRLSQQPIQGPETHVKAAS
mmetsp:Transcript_6680/g.21590  ORF Transcript_6680/g.21590 Transcript_6680/m.21590 type:complete len:242 (+) Transcript_6680:205-930(+)